MQNLITWRNPQGTEENWFAEESTIENYWLHAGKVLTAELGLCLLAATAVIETVAYTVLAVASITLYRISDRAPTLRAFIFFVKLWESSTFTTIWTIVDTIINHFYINLYTHESHARFDADCWNPTPIRLFRREDTRIMNDFYNVGHAANFHQQRVHADPQVEGAKFFEDHILNKVDNETKIAFQEEEPAVYLFCLTKAVYIYTFGEKKEEPIPRFFQEATREAIELLRKESHSKDALQAIESHTESLANKEATREAIERLRKEIQSKALQAIESHTESLTNFESDELKGYGKTLLNRLKGIATRELRGSLFIRCCLQGPISKLPDLSSQPAS